jgi:hypothetical protein
MITLSFNYCIKFNDRYFMLLFGSLSFSYTLFDRKSMTESHALGVRIIRIILILEKLDIDWE